MKNNRLKSKLKFGQTKGIALLFWLLVFSGEISMKVKAQGFYNAEVDRTSYEASLDKNWKKVIEIGEGAQAKGIDFYYLRLRKGIAYDNLGKYNRSDLEYRKANAFFPVDSLTYWYRYVALINSGRESEARVLSSKMTNWQRSYSGYKSIRLNYFGVEAGGLLGKAPTTIINNVTQVFLIQKQQGNLFFASGNGNVLLGKHFNFSLGYMFMNVGNTVNFAYRPKPSGNSGPPRPESSSWEFTTTQNAIYLGLGYQFAKGWSIFTAGNLISYDGGSIEITRKNSNGDFSYNTDKYSFSGTDYTLFAQVKKRWSSLSVEPSYSMNMVSNQVYHQMNLVGTYYPLGNNRLYLTGQISLLNHDSTNVIGGMKVGGRLAKWIWTEGNFALGKMYGSSDAGGWILNNNPDQIAWKVGLNFSFIVKNRIELPLRFGFLGREGIATKEENSPTGDSPQALNESYTYGHILINTGIKIYF